MSAGINIGELDTLVTLQRCTIGRGDKGQKTYSFADHSQVWAKMSGSYGESVSRGNLEEGNPLEATIYKVKDLTTRWRVVWGGRTYSITGIDPISRLSPLCVLTLDTIDGRGD